MHKILSTLLFAGAATAAEWTGAVSESSCGTKHASGGAEKCVQACVRKGAAPVFVVEDKVLRFANAEKVMDFLGQKVKITGKLSDDTITIETIAKTQ